MRSKDHFGKLSLGTIRCVQAVFACKSVKGAAERLRLSQPAVSQHVARFEKLSKIQVISRSGNSFNVRSDAVAGLIASIVEAEDSLRGIARDEAHSKPRLGICDYVAARYCNAVDRCLDLSRELDIHIGRASSLAEMFGKGELDVVVRPLFFYENAPELTTEVPLVWVGRTLSSMGNESERDRPIPVILETNQSPYSHYAERLLEEARTPYTILARIDDHLVRSRFLAAGLGCTAVPEFLLRSLSGQAAKVSRIPRMAAVRFGVFHNNRTVTFKFAEKIFERLLIPLMSQKLESD
ncbi:LysR family transcriptional regulator [Rhizobium sp. S95]|uniref:LysR family transcriptional regulator n=1 Tax=Ciceribacter sichuanensis TaxID=2949647 RepID=A0AAJ1C2U5_9HYPH|nr:MULTISPECIES: LysR family transcriptional regulator [unclassified Ciceribacter]MCM2396684.1 LysR family transcriptional regulator [Ciceribacter sp. S95]MCO5959823.1 LysR family transcriptional regulator [Ciceribacter sp. S101]